LNAKELKKKMDSNMIPVIFSESEIITLHALAVLGDGRHMMNKLFKKRFSPVAMKLIEEEKKTE